MQLVALHACNRLRRMTCNVQVIPIKFDITASQCHFVLLFTDLIFLMFMQILIRSALSPHALICLHENLSEQIAAIRHSVSIDTIDCLETTQRKHRSNGRGCIRYGSVTSWCINILIKYWHLFRCEIRPFLFFRRHLSLFYISFSFKSGFRIFSLRGSSQLGSKKQGVFRFFFSSCFSSSSFFLSHSFSLSLSLWIFIGLHRSPDDIVVDNIPTIVQLVHWKSYLRCFILEHELRSYGRHSFVFRSCISSHSNPTLFSLYMRTHFASIFR